MSTGTLIEAPPEARPGAGDWIEVDRGGVIWRGKIGPTDSAGGIAHWDRGHQGRFAWSEAWKQIAAPAAAAPLHPTCDNSAAVTVALGRIRPFELNPREFRKLEDGTVDPDQHGLRALAASLVAHGQQQPIIVRPVGEELFGLVDGERRYWAATLAGLTEVRVEVRALDDLQALVSTIAASSHAEAYPIADQARAVQFLRARDRSQEEIAKLLGTNQQAISALSRFNSLPGPVQQLVRDGHLSLGHVRQLVRDHLVRVPKAVIWIAEHAVETRASVRRLEAEIPFEEELPQELLRQLRTQPAMELDAGAAPAVPAPAPHPLIGTRYRWTDEMSFRGRVGTLTGVDVEGLATIEAEDAFTPDLVFIHVDRLEAKGFRRVDPAPAAVAPEPASGTLSPALAEYVETLRGLSNPALLRQYTAQYGGADPFLFDAVEQEIEERIAGGEAFLLCEKHGLYEPCPKCSAEAAASAPGPVEDADAAITRLQQQAEAAAASHGHRLGTWAFDETHHYAKCRHCTGTAVVFTNAAPPEGSLSPSLKARCEFASASAPGPAERIGQMAATAGASDLTEALRVQAGVVAAPDTEADDPENSLCVHGLSVYGDCADCDAEADSAGASGTRITWSAPAAPVAAGLTGATDDGTWSRSWNNSAASCASGAADAEPAAPDYSAMSAAEITAEMDAHEAAGIELPVDQHNARIEALEAAVLAEGRIGAAPADLPGPTPEMDPRKQPVRTAAEIAAARTAPLAAPVKPKPGALQSAEEKVAAQKGGAGAVAPPKPQPVTAVIPAAMADRLAELGGGIVPAVRAWCRLAEIAEEHKIEVPTAVELVQRFLSCCSRMGSLPDAVLAGWERKLPQDESATEEAHDGE